ncbi:MAG: holo-ACP synthase [Candidatus Bipolaricaulia bacterium]
MSIRGVGIDLVKVARLERLVDKWDDEFLNRVFTEEELEYCLTKRRKYEHLAGRFAVKEAVIKAVGEKLPWKSVEVVSGQNGRPFALVPDDEREAFSPEDMHVSITHVENYATAIAILEEK